MDDKPGGAAGPDREAFVRLYADHFDAVLGYALRRVNIAEDAADIVAETFLVAWRRPGEVPPSDSARPWLYAVARRVLANQRRAAKRRSHLADRLRADLAAYVADFADGTAAAADARRLLSTLPDKDREVLELAAWEQLEPREIAVVLNTTPLAVRSRLSRARARLRGLVSNDPSSAGHLPSVSPQLAREEQR